MSATSPTAAAPAIKATDDNLVVLLDPIEEEKTEGGVVLPENQYNKPRTGTVISVGPGERCSDSSERLPMESEAGERVLVPARVGHIVTVSGVKYLILQERDILLTLNR